MPGTPSWHRKNLRDLITMVEMWGMPNFFLTFTADEVSETRWKEITTIEKLAHGYNENFTWKDCPVECALLFHGRLHNFLNKHIMGGSKILGHVQHYLVRYEIQNRGSLHAHIILWISNEDVDKTTKEIAAYIPTVDEPTTNHSNELRSLVITKQIHRCRDACRFMPGCATCKYGFPYEPHYQIEPSIDPQSSRWLYFRPGYEHRNVVPYHPTVLLLWKAHMNIQRVTNSSISHYLLKYAMKIEPCTTLNLNEADAERLGLHGLDTVKLRIIAAAILSKPISTTEAALNCLMIPTITKSEAVEYVDSSSSELRQRLVSHTTRLY